LDRAVLFYKIVWILKDGSRSILEISNMLRANKDEVIETLIFGMTSHLKQYWELKFSNDELDINIDINEELIKNEDMNYNMRLLREYLCIETRVTLWNNLASIDGMRFLTKSERWTLFDVLKECGGIFAEDVRQIILHSYNNELNEKYMSISESRIIKKYMDIFNFDEIILLKLYKAIDKKCFVNVKLKEGIVLRNISPSRIFLDDDQNRWYLEHKREGEPFIIWLKKVEEVELLPGSNVIEDNAELFRENKKEMHRVKIRVYNEKNSRERAVGFLSSKHIIDEKISYGYSDITARVMNLEAFKKWVMEMTPQVVILEPMELKLEFHEMVNSWVKNYAAGI
jgi:hypothetical protein